MSKCYLLLGTNLGDKTTNLDQAIRLISDKIGNLITKSSIYRTAAWGKHDQGEFLNQVLCLETELSASSLLNKCLGIEMEMGRVRYERWGERLIDIDILYIDDQVLNESRLVVPHPQIQNRRFTLIPLVEIARDFVHPLLKKNHAELLMACEDVLDVSKLD